MGRCRGSWRRSNTFLVFLLFPSPVEFDDIRLPDFRTRSLICSTAVHSKFPRYSVIILIQMRLVSCRSTHDTSGNLPLDILGRQNWGALIGECWIMNIGVAFPLIPFIKS